uniref:Uncharacterized protein n=1 Tax=Rattus norvegicus TaxID=10116 RepID=A0ABK0M0L1_RAT
MAQGPSPACEAAPAEPSSNLLPSASSVPTIGRQRRGLRLGIFILQRWVHGGVSATRPKGDTSARCLPTFCLHLPQSLLSFASKGQNTLEGATRTPSLTLISWPVQNQQPSVLCLASFLRT